MPTTQPCWNKAVSLLLKLAVYDEKELVAHIRLVGDGHWLVFVQDLGRPDHQRQGIGETLKRL